ncbi:hypothetical protein FB567DRAFT_552989 [Paraphoma chrysanthemicola]|uniref:Uncharacterized protein n=1 Tax=Paraphoma chrysanthemicola TaxID=798071 RepID=A0A8K0QZ04_9PLEO|nr:hypothetical protein FB567DRAFT_552989 [Paraphoma chrysanthemicola]
MRLLAVSVALVLSAAALPVNDNHKKGQSDIDPSVQILSASADEIAGPLPIEELKDPVTTGKTTNKDYLLVNIYKDKQWSGESKGMWTLVIGMIRSRLSQFHRGSLVDSILTVTVPLIVYTLMSANPVDTCQISAFLAGKISSPAIAAGIDRESCVLEAGI